MPSVKLNDLWPLIEEAFSRGQTITIPVTGTSMRPTLEHGDAAVLQKADISEIQRGDVLMYRRKDGQFVLHRAVKVHGDMIDFCGDAQVGIEKNVPKKAVLARMIAYEKKGRRYDERDIRKDARRRLGSRPRRALKSKLHRLYVFDKLKKSLDPHKFVGTYLKKYIGAIILLCLSTALTAVCMLGMTLVSGHIINKTLAGAIYDLKEWFFLLMFLLLLVCGLHFAYSRLRMRVVMKLKNEIREDLFSVLLTKQYGRVQQIHSGEILNRFTDDLMLVVDTSVTIIPQAISMATKLIGGIAVLMLTDPLFTVVLLVVGGVCSIGFQFFSRIYKKLHRECQESEGRTRSFLQECVANLIVIKSFANESGVIAKLSEYQKNNYHKNIRRNTYSSIGNTMIYFGFTFAYYAAMAWGILRVAGVMTNGRSTMLVGTFVVVLQIMEQIRSPFRNASGLMPQYYAMLASAERLQEITLLPDEERCVLSMPLESVYNEMKTISLRDVSFAYHDKKPVLKGFDLEVQKGELVAIMGASGSGKTTMIKLLLGLIRPQSGSISLELQSESMEIDASTRGLFAYVPQGNMILSGTIEENICFGNRDVSKEDLERAVKLSCLDGLIASLENGLKTRIGERGIGLSEGQIQRVAIARALLSNAPILLLDECTSALDLATEKQLIENLKSLTDRTIIFISHREAVLKRADQIVKMPQQT